MNPEEMFADDRSPAFEQERIHEDELHSLMRSILDWAISFLNESSQGMVPAVWVCGFAGAMGREAGRAPQAVRRLALRFRPSVVARRLRPRLPDGRPRQGGGQAGLLPVLLGEEEAREADKARLALGPSARKEWGEASVPPAHRRDLANIGLDGYAWQL